MELLKPESEEEREGEKEGLNFAIAL